uniref:Uncharacterized protein n=1 Tax=Nymphaea colorata TaxID=210225 RepID=A0A5K1EL93_9MAGN
MWIYYIFPIFDAFSVENFVRIIFFTDSPSLNLF